MAVRGQSPARKIVVRWAGRSVIRREERQYGWTCGNRSVVGSEEADDSGRPRGGLFVVGAVKRVDEGWGPGGQEFGKGSFSLRARGEGRRVSEREMEVMFGVGVGENEMGVGEIVWG